MELFRCGESDLIVLDNINGDFEEFIDRLEETPIQDISLDGLIRSITAVGIIILKESLDTKIEELRSLRENACATSEDLKTLKALESLNPNADIQVDLNGSFTIVRFKSNGDIYRQYLAFAVDTFKYSTGFSIAN